MNDNNNQFSNLNNSYPNSEPVTPYRATSNNFNTSISNPNMNVNDKMDVNIQNNASISNGMLVENYNLNNPTIKINPNPIPETNNTVNNIPNPYEQMPSVNDVYGTVKEDVTEVSYNNYNSNQNVTAVSNNNSSNNYSNSSASYVPNMETNKKRKKTVKISLPQELQTAIIIVFILILFTTVMPNIYDIIRNLQMNLS